MHTQQGRRTPHCFLPLCLFLSQQQPHQVNLYRFWLLISVVNVIMSDVRCPQAKKEVKGLFVDPWPRAASAATLQGRGGGRWALV